jgi:tripartite-type tricarboxylate transporter receptor subunit TctC
MQTLFKLTRRVLTVALLTATLASAQTSPSKPIEWVVPYPAGGGTDVVARLLAESMGQSIIVANKRGAATNIGAEYVSRAKPDGYVLMSADTATLAANPALYSKLSYSAEKNLAPVVQDVEVGQVPFMFVDTASGYPFITSGKLRAIGMASLKRVKNFEEIPALAEQGPKGFEAFAWQGLVVPAGTPPEVIAKLNSPLLTAMESTALMARFQTLGLEATPSNPRQMADYAASERVKWANVIKASGIKVE